MRFLVVLDARFSCFLFGDFEDFLVIGEDTFGFATLVRTGESVVFFFGDDATFFLTTFFFFGDDASSAS